MGRQQSTSESSLRAYVARTLPGRSAILVSNRGPQDAREDGTFKRGAGGVVTGLLTLAEATGADWVACARTDAERKQAAAGRGGLKVRRPRGPCPLPQPTPSRQQEQVYHSAI